MVGRSLSHYRLLEKLGEGGMGVVYLAQDEHLDRRVALKLLPTGAFSDEATRKRLKREALLLSRLNHPRIETVYDFDTAEGIDFLVVEYVCGETLEARLARGRLPEDEAVRVGTQVAEALEEAHRLGIVHRDLKPSNVVITPRGEVKLLDFGIAKLLRPDLEGPSLESLTSAESALGTMPYMAPEQLLGKSVDERADCYALGVVLYEAVCRQRPFGGSSPIVLANAIINDPPPSPRRFTPDVSPPLEAIILKCLEKNPEDRYQSARELLVDLRRAAHAPPRAEVPQRRRGRKRIQLAALAAALALAVLGSIMVATRLRRASGEAPIRSLAVLPLVNMSADPGQEYFTDGMTEQLITALAQIRSLKVISRTSVMRFKGTREPLPNIARQLNVDAIVEGSVLRMGDQVRISAQLIRGQADQHLWADSYDRRLDDVLTLQRDVARAIAQQIQVELTPQEQARLAAGRVVNPEAQEAYFQGRFYAAKLTQAALLMSANFYQHAVELDSTYALAHAGLAESYMVLGNSGALAAREAFPRAEAAARKALALDPDLAEAHSALGCVKLFKDWEWRGAEEEFRRAIQLNPNYAAAHSWYASYLSATGRHRDAIAEVRKAEELDPLSMSIKLNVGMRYYYARQHEQAVEQFQRVLQLDPGYSDAHYWLGLAYEQLKQYPQAIAEFEQLGSVALGPMGHAYAVSGQRRVAEELLSQLTRPAAAGQAVVAPFDLATICAGLGKKDQAIHWLERSLAERGGYLTFLKVEPVFDDLRSDPRFAELLRRIGVPS